MRRGDIVTVAAPGDSGKPRPAVVVQANMLNLGANSTIVALLTSHLMDSPLLRLTVAPDATNGLTVPSLVQANRLLRLPTTRIGAVIGRRSDGEMVEPNRLLAVVIGLA